MDIYDSGIQGVDGKGKQSLQRNKLQETLCQYTSDTLGLIATVSEFCLSLSKWKEEMTANITKLTDIKERADKNGSFFKNMLTRQKTLDARREKLEQELVEVFKDIIGGLEQLNKFVDAVETLAVTSPHVFEENNQVLQLPEGTSLKRVQAVITAAIQVCPLLLQLKKEAHTFFSPSLHNVEVHSAYLDNYINMTETISDMMEESSVREFEKMKNTKTVVRRLPADLSEGDIQDMLHRIECLTDIRKDQHFRFGFVFQDDSSSGFIKKFGLRETEMLQFLTEMEVTAVKLDRMKKGSQISNVAGSSVGVVSGVLGIVGLALTPVTAGASLILMMTGLGLGATSAANAIVTTGTEIGVNRREQKKAEVLLHKFMEDVEVLQVFLEEVSNKALEKDSKVKGVLGAGRVIKNACSAGVGIASIVDDVVGLTVLKSEQLMVTKSGAALIRQGQGVSTVTRVASDIPDIGQATVKGTLALSKTWRGIFIGLNAFCIGFDVWSIVTSSMNLAKGSPSEVSQFIRARASLFRSELDSWKKIHDSLSEGMATSEEKKNKLERPFYSS